jgi:microcompartment protein CcmK/EutM
MLLARVIGTVVCTRKEPKIEGIKFLLLEKLDAATMQGKKDYVVAMDTVGAGLGEVVFYVAGSSARITAIVDTVELGGRPVYQKDAK